MRNVIFACTILWSALWSGWVAAQDLAGSQGIIDPALGTGLAEIADWSTEQPFLDLMKTARPWIGHQPGGWGEWDHQSLVAGGYLTPDGWPRAIPPGAERLEALVLTEQPEAAQSLAGTYLLTWEGQAEVGVNGRVGDVRRDGNSVRFTYSPGPGFVAVAVSRVDPGDPIRGITLVREDRAQQLEAGAVFNPDFLARIGDFRTLRFMDWMRTNGSTQVSWKDRPRVDHATWAERGVPVEIMVRLANEVGADPWFNMPHMADDAYVSEFAAYVRDHLDPRLKAHVEWSNEVWNWGFAQAAWAEEQALARWGAAPGGDAWMQFAGLRAAQVADIWAATFGSASDDRLIRVVATQTDWLGLEQALLQAPLAVAEGRPAPVESFDAYAVTGYFEAERDDGSSLTDGSTPEVGAWIKQGTASQEITLLAGASVRNLVERLWPYHADVAAAHGLRLVAYEGGTHLVGLGPAVDDEALTNFLTEYSYSPEMASLYRDLLAGWRDAGGTLFVHYLDVAMPSQWGSWGALRHLDDANPRWEELLAHNAVAPEWESRDPSAFANGRAVSGTPGGDTLEGTTEEDDLLAGGGDDTLIADGADRLHGGEGFDRAILSGGQSDWSRRSEGATEILTKGWITVRLTEIEEVTFADTGETFSVPSSR